MFYLELRNPGFPNVPISIIRTVASHCQAHKLFETKVTTKNVLCRHHEHREMDCLRFEVFITRKHNHRAGTYDCCESVLSEIDPQVSLFKFFLTSLRFEHEEYLFVLDSTMWTKSSLDNPKEADRCKCGVLHSIRMDVQNNKTRKRTREFLCLPCLAENQNFRRGLNRIHPESEINKAFEKFSLFEDRTRSPCREDTAKHYMITRTTGEKLNVMGKDRDVAVTANEMMAVIQQEALAEMNRDPYTRAWLLSGKYEARVRANLPDVDKMFPHPWTDKEDLSPDLGN